MLGRDLRRWAALAAPGRQFRRAEKHGLVQRAVPGRLEIKKGPAIAGPFSCIEVLFSAGYPRCTWNGENDWFTGISSMRLMFMCAGSVAIQKRVSATSSAVIGFAPL